MAASDQPMRDRAYLYIQRKIARGDLPAGTSISELALAKELGSSRTPIREAVRQLVAEGLLEHTPNRGAVVVQLARQDITDLYELREALEVYAVGKVARNGIRIADVTRLRGLAGEIESLRKELQRDGKNELSDEQMHRFVGSDLSFHTLLMRAAANVRIQKVVNETRLLIRVFAIHRRGHTIDELERIHRSHSDVLDAVIANDAPRAMACLSEHIQQSMRERLDEYDHWEREASLRESLPVFFEAPGTADPNLS